MRKEIHHATVYYKWRTIRMSKGVEVKSKKWNEAKHETCVTDLEPSELEKNKRFLNSLGYKHKSKVGIEIKITKVVSHRYLCMSHDVY